VRVQILHFYSPNRRERPAIQAPCTCPPDQPIFDQEITYLTTEMGGTYSRQLVSYCDPDDLIRTYSLYLFFLDFSDIARHPSARSFCGCRSNDGSPWSNEPLSFRFIRMGLARLGCNMSNVLHCLYQSRLRKSYCNRTSSTLTRKREGTRGAVILVFFSFIKRRLMKRKCKNRESGVSHPRSY
jgi:hypothetical protein